MREREKEKKKETNWREDFSANVKANLNCARKQN